MRQFIEIVTDASVEVLLDKEHLFLKGESWKLGPMGRILPSTATLTDDKLFLSLEVQSTTPPEPIPLSTLREGTLVQLARDFGRVILADARINKSWLEPATRSSWKNIAPMSENDRAKLDYSRTFTMNEYERIKLGLIPYATGDWWFAYFESDWLHCHRATTGIEVFQVHIEQVTEKYAIRDVWVNKAVNPNMADAGTLVGVLSSLCYEAKVFE